MFRIARNLLAAMVSLLLLGSCSLFSPADEGSGSLYGLFVGIADYQDPGIPDLTFTDDDALQISRALLSYRSWDAGRMTVLLNGAATKAAIKSALADLAGRAGSSDTVVFYYSGHGFPGPDAGPGDELDGMDEYISPTDSINQAGNYGNDISDDELADMLAPFDARVVVILDSCYSGGFHPPESGHQAMTMKSYNKGGVDLGVSEGGNTFSLPLDLGTDDRVVMTSSREDQLSWEYDLLAHSVFTFFLIEGLGDARADESGNGAVSTLELFNYARPETEAIDTPSPQNPVLRGPASDTLIAS